MAQCIRPINLPRTETSVPCGHCGFCLQNRKQDWQFRIANELKYAITAFFVTLTYSDDYVPVKNGVDVLDKTDLQKFFKRLRKAHALHSHTQIRYYAVGEYGTQYLRPHYHIILFNAHQQDIEKAWPLGFVKFDKVEMGSVGYVVGYVSSIDNHSVERGVPKQFSVMSRRPAIGYRYLQTHQKWHTDGMRNFQKVNGITGRLPRYYKTKMFTKEQQKILSERGQMAWEQSNDSWYQYYKRLGYPDPSRVQREMAINHEKKIYQAIENQKLQL